MDLVDFDQEVFDQIEAEYRAFADALTFKSITAIPLSALQGDNVIERSSRTLGTRAPRCWDSWKPLKLPRITRLQLSLPCSMGESSQSDFRVSPAPSRPEVLLRAMLCKILPSGQDAIIREVVLFDKSLPRALPKQSVTLTLDREVDVSRGDVIVPVTRRAKYRINSIHPWCGWIKSLATLVVDTTSC